MITQPKPNTPAASMPRRPFVARPPANNNQGKQANYQPRVFRTPIAKVATPTFKPLTPTHHLRPSFPRLREANETTKLRIMVVGGLEEVGRNCTFIEYGNDIIIIDMGLQFPEEDMPGIDYIIPNIGYLK